jgi:hypothetical protein
MVSSLPLEEILRAGKKFLICFKLELFGPKNSAGFIFSMWMERECKSLIIQWFFVSLS